MSKRGGPGYRDAVRTAKRRHGTEEAAPGAKHQVRLADVVDTAMKSGPVKRLADMTEEEQKQALATIRPPWVRP